MLFFLLKTTYLLSVGDPGFSKEGGRLYHEHEEIWSETESALYTTMLSQK